MIWQEWFIIQKSRFMKIWQETTNFRHLVIIVPIVDWWLKERGFTIPLKYFVPIIAGCFFLIWIVGILYDRAHLIHYEADFNNKRNPLLMKQVDELTKIRKLLEKFK